ncbi:MAG: 3-hydroxyacyl-CoA dehydrogenase family protein [Thaumarchaeota archaeon]|nr:3-hydroxyacyl-CoA dehydrogenase family protein [Nitrososphaerota archaeon]
MALPLSPVRTVAVLGFGLMGSQIAQIFAQTGLSVRAFDVNSDQLDSGMELVRTGKYGLDSLVSKNRISREDVERVYSRITLTRTIEEASTGADLILEAAIEELQVKQEIFRKVALTSGSDTILASNTSTLTISQIAEPLPLETRKRLIGMHFFNPPQITKLVEIVKTKEVEDVVISRVQAITRELHKTPIVVVDTPGFVVNRIGLSAYAEASALLERGVSSVKDIDLAMKLGYGYPMGPFELADLVGLDSRLRNMQSLYESTRDDRFKPPRILEQLVKEGYLGDPAAKKGSKGGYYEYYNFDRTGQV